MSHTHRGATLSFHLACAVSAAFVFKACEPPKARRAELAQGQHALAAFCEVSIIDVGTREIESDYLPHVVSCENGAASFEALKAQAVAARSYLYYKLERSGEIADGQSDQVYSCNRPPQQQHFDAVAETSGQVLQYQGVQVAAFYVAGAIPSAPSCVATDEDTDLYNTERYVTYNQGLSGEALNQTTLGWVNPNNLANRGCQSQNGADCLSDQGWGYEEILRFYYGADIELVSAEGPCVSAVTPEPGGAEGGAEAGARGGGEGGEPAQGGMEALAGVMTPPPPQGAGSPPPPEGGQSGGGEGGSEAGSVAGFEPRPPVAGDDSPPPPGPPYPPSPDEPDGGFSLEGGARSPSTGGGAEGCDSLGPRARLSSLWALLIALCFARRFRTTAQS